MKKQLIFPVFVALFALNLLSSCRSNSENSGQLQEPTTQQGTPTAKSETEEGDDDDKDGKSAVTAPANGQATVIGNLTAAFTGETTASAKYAAYSKKALAEGFPQIAMMFKAASASENIHANNHRSVLEDMSAPIPTVTPEFTVKATKENLLDAIAGESYEISTMYPEFIANAKGNQLALISLNYAYKTEKKHKVLYDKALAALQSNQVNALSMQYFVCPTCGNTYDTTPPKRCGISMTSAEKFITIAKV